MPLGEFTVTFDGDILGAGTEKSATYQIQILGQDFIKDADDNKVYFSHRSAKTPVPLSLPYTETLKTDVDTGSSTVVAYRIRVRTAFGDGGTVEFMAPADGTVLYFSDLVSNYAGPPVPEDIATRAEDAADAAAASAASIDREAANGVAGLDSSGKLYASRIPDLFATRYTPEAFGAVGDGVTNDTTAVRNCFNAANADLRAGVTGTIWHPGATVALNGTYNLSSLSTPIDIMCNVETNRGRFIIPAAYAGVAVRVGHTTSGSYFQTADISLPDIAKPNSTSIVAGSVGTRTQNIGDSHIRWGRTNYFETGINLSGDGQGTAYNTLEIGWVNYCKIPLSLKPHTASGWANQNTFVGGSVQQSPGYDGGDGAGTGIRRTGWRHVVLDGSAGNYVNGNTFLGTSFEGDVSEYWLWTKTAADNHFIGTRHEQGTAGVAVTVSGDTLTKTAHGVAVGDMLTFGGSAAPGGMFFASPYYVVSVTTNTFKVAPKKGGTGVVFSSAGTAVTYFRPPRAYFDLTGTINQNITVEKAMTQQGVMEIVKSGGAGTTNLLFHRPGWETVDTFNPEDIPLYRARNSSGAAGLTRAAFAAYASTVNPVEDPLGWGAGLSDAGPVWAASGAEIGRLTNSAGIMQYKRPADSVSFEVASCRRAAGFTAISALSLAAGATTTTTVTLTGAAVSDYVVVVPNGNLPSGVSIAYARVSAANTITIGFLNATASTVSLTADVQPMVIRRFF